MAANSFTNEIRTGMLSVDEIGRGMYKAFRNSQALIEDAEILLNVRPGRALSLAVLAMEELGKVILLADAAAKAAKAPIEWRDLERDFNLRSHQSKQLVIAIYGKTLLEGLAKKTGEGLYSEGIPAGVPPLLDWFKQMGFYVDVACGKFVSPDEFGKDNLDWAEWLIATVKERIQSVAPMHQTEESSIKVARHSAELETLLAEAKSEDELKEAFRDCLHSLIKSNAQTSRR